MRVAVVGLVVAAILATVFAGSSRTPFLYAQQVPSPNAPAVVPSGLPAAAAGDLIAFSTDSGNGVQQVTVIDAKARVMSVYHIDRGKGEIELKSVRDIRCDLLMDDFNGVRPLPREIRALLEQK